MHHITRSISSSRSASITRVPTRWKCSNHCWSSWWVRKKSTDGSKHRWCLRMRTNFLRSFKNLTLIPISNNGKSRSTSNRCKLNGSNFKRCRTMARTGRISSFGASQWLPTIWSAERIQTVNCSSLNSKIANWMKWFNVRTPYGPTASRKLNMSFWTCIMIWWLLTLTWCNLWHSKMRQKAATQRSLKRIRWEPMWLSYFKNRDHSSKKRKSSRHLSAISWKQRQKHCRRRLIRTCRTRSADWKGTWRTIKITYKPWKKRMTSCSKTIRTTMKTS